MKKIIMNIKNWIKNLSNKNKNNNIEVFNYEELIKALKQDKEIVLQQDIQCAEPIEITKNTVVDCNGHEIYCQQDRQGFAYDATSYLSPFYTALSRVEHEDGTEVKQTEKGKGIFRVKIHDNIENPSDLKKLYDYINISCGWTAYTFPIVKAENDYIYFKSYGTDYCVDFDWYQGNSHKFTQCRLICCSKEQFAKYLFDVNESHLTIKNGIIHGGIKANKSWITLSNSTLRDCTEYGIYATDSNVNVNDTIFRYTWKSAIKCIKGGLRVCTCAFIEVNQGRQNTGAIDTDGECYIYDNHFIDFGSFGIRAGKVKALTAEECPTSYIGHNEFETKDNQGVVTDTGCIYLAANNKSAKIEHNTIRGYQGRKNNHAIYCDDGAYNFILNNNKIINCPTGYAISSRCADPSKTPRGYAGGTPNTNRLIKNNYCESGVWFGGNADVEDNNCIYENNVVHENTDYKSIISGVKIIN